MSARGAAGRPGRVGTGTGVQIAAVTLADAYREGRRLTPRDRWLLGLLADHRVLTTEQVTALAFNVPRRARKRLEELAGRGVLARFRRHVPVGSQSWRYTLGPLGEVLHAARTGAPMPRPGKITEKITRLAESRGLDHRIGVNGFFVALLAHARTHPGCALVDWWSEQRTAGTTGKYVRPDAYGRWTQPHPHPGRAGMAGVGAAPGVADEVRFFLEYDRGGEPLDKLVGKLGAYAAMTESKVNWPVLFVFTSSTREANFTRAATAAGWPRQLSVATTAADQHTPTHPAGSSAAGEGPLVALSPALRVWRPLGEPRRRLLIELDQPARDGPAHTARPPHTAA